MEDQYIIIPTCSDLNRGDQALAWETKRLAQQAGFIGRYSLLSERGEPVEQSRAEGYRILTPVLEHPSRKYARKDNIVYDARTKLRWGVVALRDFLFSYLLLNASCRKLLLPRIRNPETAETVRAFAAARAVFMKGGGLLQSHGGLTATYATYYRLYHILLAQALGKPVYILPNSFGPFEGPGVRRMVRAALSRCKLVTARENRSAQEVKRELGLDIPVYPDLAFFLENGSQTREALCARLDIPADRKIVAITMRPYRFPHAANPAAAYETFQRELRDFIRWLYGQGYMPLLVEHTLAVMSHENDGECIRAVTRGLDGACYRLLSDPGMDCRALKSVYGCCDYIVGTRFHSLIFAVSNGVPGIAISYDGYKSIGIMRDMGLGEYVLDIAGVTSARLQEKFTALTAHPDQIREKVHGYIDAAQRKRAQLAAALEE